MTDRSNLKRKSLIITGLGTFMGTLDSSIVNVSLPTISRELGTTINMVGWVILAYAIMVFSLLMVFGALSEKKGYQFSYTVGYTVFLIGSALCGASQSIYMLIAARAIQGTGAAFLVSVGPALITHSFPSEERGRGLSIIAMVVSTGLMLGPPLGGFLVEYVGWRWIFYVNLPVSMMGIYFTRRYIADFPVSNPDKKIGLPSTVSLSLGLLSLMTSLLLYSKGQLNLVPAVIMLAASAALFGLFFIFEINLKTRLIGIDIFKNRVFVLSGASMLLIFIALISITILLPFYLEEVKGLTPDSVGLYLMTVPLCMLFVARPAGWLADRFPARIISTIGSMLMMVGLFIFVGLKATSPMYIILSGLFLTGVGMALFSTPNTSTIMGSVRKFQLGSASGILATIRTLGIALGAGLSIAIFSYYQNIFIDRQLEKIPAFINSYQHVYKIMLIILAIGVVFSALRGDIMNNQGKSRAERH